MQTNNEPLSDLVRHLEAVSRHTLATYRPYPKQALFHEAGGRFRERCLMAGNQDGKTHPASMEMAMHLSGRYPKWWRGKRFQKPIRAWVAGVSAEEMRDTVQRKLFGAVGELGTGSIPATDYTEKNITWSKNAANCVDSARIKHQRGGYSWLLFKQYTQERRKWQGESLDLIWYDEEPPLDLFSEGEARLITGDDSRGGHVMLTFTPLLGNTEVVDLFFPVPQGEFRCLVQMTIEDAEHIPIERREEIIASWPAHEREARAYGIPMLGSGRVFGVPEERIAEMPIGAAPSYWQHIGGLDFGWGDHPTAAVRLLYDQSSDIVHLVQVYCESNPVPAFHAAAIRDWGEGHMPWAWPHDGRQMRVTDGQNAQATADYYADQGLDMLPEHAQFESGGFGLEAKVMALLSRMETGKFKVARHLFPFWSEFRTYHRKDGRIVSRGDDVLSAVMTALISLRYAAPIGDRVSNLTGYVDNDYDPLGGSA